MVVSSMLLEGKGVSVSVRRCRYSSRSYRSQIRHIPLQIKAYVSA